MGFVLIGMDLNAQGQLTLQVEVGFNGHYFPERSTPIRVGIEYQGPPLSGELVLQQRIDRPLEGPQLLELRHPVRLGGRTKAQYEFYLPLSAYPPPGAGEPELTVMFLSQGRTLASQRVKLGEAVSSEPLVIVLSDLELLRVLPTGERVEYLDERSLPKDWRGYGGVRRLYLGRFDVHLLSADQIEALLQWVSSGGELVVLSGENFPLQDAPWLRDLLPFRVEGVRSLEGFGEEVVVGIPLGEVLDQQGAYPLLVRGEWGLGRVYLSTISLGGSGEAEQAVWERLTPQAVDQTGPPPLGRELLRQKELHFPARFLIGGLMALYVIGFGLLSLRMVRQVPSNRGKGWRNLLVIAAWIALFTAVTMGYLERPAFTRPVQSIEVGLIRASARTPWALVQSWYSLLVKRAIPLELEAARDALVMPLGGTSLSLREDPDALRIAFPPSPIGAWEQRHLYIEELIPLKIDVELEAQGDSAAVRKPILRVYNKSQWRLRDLVFQQGRIYYRVGDLLPGEAQEIGLSGPGEGLWPSFSEEGETFDFEGRVRQRLYREVQPQLERSGQGFLLAWVEDERLRVDPQEDRRGLKLLVIELDGIE